MRSACLLVVIGLIASGSGCTTLPRGAGALIDAPKAARIEALTQDLAALAPNNPEAVVEARLIARTTIGRSLVLRDRFRPAGPATINNVYINMGWRARGLCYQWANDLLEPLEALELRHFDLHWGTAFFGIKLKEHNSVVVTARGQPFEEGIVLDGWRCGGRLVWVRVSDDQKYPWRELSGAALGELRPAARRVGGSP